MVRKLMMMLLVAGFVGNVAFAEGDSSKKGRKPKREMTAEQKAKREANKQRLIAKLKEKYPEDIAKYDALIADGKKKEAEAVIRSTVKKQELAVLDKLAEKYPEQVANIKKLMEDNTKAGRKALNQARKELWQQVRADNAKAKKAPKAKKVKKAKKAEAAGNED